MTCGGNCRAPGLPCGVQLHGPGARNRLVRHVHALRRRTTRAWRPEPKHHGLPHRAQARCASSLDRASSHPCRSQFPPFIRHCTRRVESGTRLHTRLCSFTERAEGPTPEKLSDIGAALPGRVQAGSAEAETALFTKLGAETVTFAFTGAGAMPAAMSTPIACARNTHAHTSHARNHPHSHPHPHPHAHDTLAIPAGIPEEAAGAPANTTEFEHSIEATPILAVVKGSATEMGARGFRACSASRWSFSRTRNTPCTRNKTS